MADGDRDKYPPDSARRRFVRGVAGSGVLAGLATGGATALEAATSATGAGGGSVRYVGIENTAGPAPRAMPQVPVAVDEAGYLVGRWPAAETRTVDGREVAVAEMDLGGVTYSSRWFQYCGLQTYAGIDPEADRDDHLRSAPGVAFQWQREGTEPGEKLHVDAFADYETWGNDIGDDGVGKPADATWRSREAPPTEVLPVQVVRSTRVRELAAGDGPLAEWLRASTDEGFIAWLNRCTHFCCVPAGFKATPQSRGAGAANEVYCQCHQSVYDPFSPVEETFVALPRPG